MAHQEWDQWNFSFSAAGWLKMYQFGVAKGLQQHGVGGRGRFAGSSAGSLVATGLVLNVDFDEVKKFALKCVDDAHKSFLNAFALRRYVESCMEFHLSEDSHTRIDNRLEVCVTTLPWCHGRRYTEFSSKDDLKKALLASCCMTPLAGFPFVYRDELVFDGGLSAFQPLIHLPEPEDHSNISPFSLKYTTITVSPFYCSRSDIKPSRYVPMWWALYPPSVREMEEVYQLGYKDALQFLQKQSENFQSSPPPTIDSVEIEEIITEAAPKKPSDYDEKNLPRNPSVGIIDFNDIQYLESSITNLSSVTFLKNRTTVQPPPIKEFNVQQKGASSFFLDLLLLIFILFFVKPVAFSLLYVELYVKSLIYISWANFLAVSQSLSLNRLRSSPKRPVSSQGSIFSFFSNKSVFECYKRSLELFLSAINFKLFLRAWIGSSISINEEQLFNQSFIYRLLVFVL